MRCTIAHVPVIAQQMFEDAQQKRYFFFLAFQPKIFEIWYQDTQRFAEKKFLKRWNYTIHELVEN